MLDADPNMVWTNQYENSVNWESHYQTTAFEIHSSFPNLAAVFVGAGTTGTLMGCARYFRDHHEGTKVIPVDSVGSITFGGPAEVRHIPGLGASSYPPLFDRSQCESPIMVDEMDTVRMVRYVMNRHGLSMGGSTGTVLCGIKQYLEQTGFKGPIVGISPDFGENYCDTIYSDEWVNEKFGMIHEKMEFADASIS
jgi:cysteine synthase A